MFSLIITIIAIALVAVLAVATMYYLNQSGGTAAESAKATRALQEGSQIIGAVEMYKSDNYGALPTGTASDIQTALVTGNYLSQWPIQNGWTVDTNYVTTPNVDQAQCLAINAKLGYTSQTIPDCSTVEGQTLCCSTSS